MQRMTSVVAGLLLLWACTAVDEVGPPDRVVQDEFYAVFIEEVLQRSLAWLGPGRVPSSYCVALVPWLGETWPSPAQAPSRGLIERLNGSLSDVAYHSVRDCILEVQPRAPTGEPAGMLWVAALDPQEPGRLFGGWLGLGDSTEWGCTVRESAGSVVLDKCELLMES